MPSSRPARIVAAAMATVVLALGAACGDRGNDAIPPVPAGVTTPLPTMGATSQAGPVGGVAGTAATAATSARALAVATHSIGEPARTAGGNTITLHAIDSSTAGRVAADIEACAAGNGVQVRPDSFQLELAGGATVPPADSGREPVLQEITLAAGACAQGWLTFPVAAGQTPSAVVFRGSSVIRWPLT